MIRRGSLLLFFVACGSPHLERASFDRNVCTMGHYRPFDGVTLSKAGYLELDVDSSPQSSTNPPSRSVLASTGTACATAPDKTACTAAIKAAKPAQRTWQSGSCSGAGCTDAIQFFVFESAGVVHVIDTMDALRALVAPIDSANEAVLLAIYGHQLNGMDCTQPQAKLLPDGSFDVFLGHGDGKCLERVERIVNVATTGTSVEKASLVNKASQQCISP